MPVRLDLTLWNGNNEASNATVIDLQGEEIHEKEHENTITQLPAYNCDVGGNDADDHIGGE